MKIEKLYGRYSSIIPDFDLFIHFIRKPLLASFRINTLKAPSEKIISLLNDIKLKQIPFYANGYYTDTKYPLGNHITHNLGYIYVQEIASMAPAIVLDPRPGEIVLDLCAAPGSKTTQIAQLMANRGLLVANETSPKRMQGLIHNVKRCGLMNEAVISIGGQKIQRVFVDYFDRILIDAPCSAEGTIRKSKAVLYHWGVRNIQHMSKIQIGLAVSGFRALRPGGTLVYSTCTIAPEENEMVVSYLLEKFPEAELLPIELKGLRVRPAITDWQGVRFEPRITNCVRILPQDNDTAPFFIAKVTKKGSAEPRMRKPDKIEFDRALVEHLVNRFGVEAQPFKQYAVFKNRNENVIATPEAFSFREMKTIRKGLEFGRVYDCDIKPDNDLVQLFGSSAKRNVIDLEGWQAEKFLKGEIIKIDHRPDIEMGFVITRFQNLALGVGRYNGQEVKSAVKRERRIQ